MRKISLPEKLARFHEHWSPKIVGEVDGLHVKLVKIQGEFVFHRHDGQDELFLVLKGRLDLHFLDKTIELREGDLVVVPAGAEHKTSAREEAHVLTISAAELLNTGNVREARTVLDPARI